MSSSPTRFIVLLSCVTLWCIPSILQSQPRYTLELIDPPVGFQVVQCSSLNDSGAVLCWGASSGTRETGPFIWKDGVSTPLAGWDHRAGQPNDINNRGQVAGSFYPDTSNLNIQRGFIWESGTFRVLDELGPGTDYRGGGAVSINDDGITIGMCYSDFGPSVFSGLYGVRWSPDGSVSSIMPRVTSCLPGHEDVYRMEYTQDIGPTGVILGNLTQGVCLDDSPLPADVANFLVLGDSLLPLRKMASQTVYTFSSVNVRNEVLGRIGAFVGVWKDGIPTLLDTTGITSSNATGMNDSGVVVGTATTGGCLWIDGVRHDLKPLVRNADGWTTLVPTRINNRGEILATGIYGGKGRRCILRPAPVEIFFPDSNHVFAAEVQDTIRWSGTAKNGWEIFYSLDDGATFTKIDTILAPGDSVLAWTPPDTIRTTSAGRFKVVDVLDPTIVTVSERVVLRGRDLVKVLTDGSLRPYWPSTDGWSFENDTIPLWPSAWWDQFRYNQLLDPYTGIHYPITTEGGAAIAMAPPSFYPDWPLFVETFGAPSCYNEDLTGGFEYNPLATGAWVIAGELSFQGACNGLAVGSLLGFSRHADFRGAYPDMPGFVFMHDVPMDTSVRKVINAIQLSQAGKVQREYLPTAQWASPTETLIGILAMFSTPGPADDRILALKDNVKSGGHAVLPYRVVRDTARKYAFRVYVYDPNNPGSDTVYIEIDTLTNTWTDRLPGLGFGTGGKGCYLDVPASAYLVRPVLGPGEAAMSPASPTAAATSSGPTLFVTSSHSTEVVDTAGAHIGFADSVAFNDMDAAGMLLPRTGKYSPPYGYVLPFSDSYFLRLSGFTKPATMFLLNKGAETYGFRREDAEQAQTDWFSLSGGVEYGNHDPAPKAPAFFARSDRPGSMTEYDLTGLTVLPGDSLGVRLASPETLEVANRGVHALTYALSARVIDTSSAVRFRHSSVTIGAGDRQSIALTRGVPTLAVVFTDAGSDGTVDDTLFIANEPTGVGDSSPPALPVDYTLDQNYPNPFNPVTSIGYGLPRTTRVRLRVVNTLGQEVATLVDAVQPAGYHRATFDASDLPGGLYLCVLTTDARSVTRKMILVR